MTTRYAITLLASTAAALGAGVATASPAAAGGVGDFLSPAFGTLCGNYNNGAYADGATSSGTGTAGGNVAGVPVGSALNQCGGADAPGGHLAGQLLGSSALLSIGGIFDGLPITKLPILGDALNAGG